MTILAILGWVLTAVVAVMLGKGTYGGSKNLHANFGWCVITTLLRSQITLI